MQSANVISCFVNGFRIQNGFVCFESIHKQMTELNLLLDNISVQNIQDIYQNKQTEQIAIKSVNCVKFDQKMQQIVFQVQYFGMTEDYSTQIKFFDAMPFMKKFVANKDTQEQIQALIHQMNPMTKQKHINFMRKCEHTEENDSQLTSSKIIEKISPNAQKKLASNTINAKINILTSTLEKCQAQLKFLLDELK
ncbi:Hypothetical_protein [Hexamita inflata]|uniref:Hypothetical_protein n=1 Tax=Hexamita inflata TaxID=28002 RepID=A0AA86TE85_9EUKA|nr:Hypothetical protein HINF_LOCUS2671 [Hexamita inflata]